jgi:hypothetical protein
MVPVDVKSGVAGRLQFKAQAYSVFDHESSQIRAPTPPFTPRNRLLKHQRTNYIGYYGDRGGFAQFCTNTIRYYILGFNVSQSCPI